MNLSLLAMGLPPIDEAMTYLLDRMEKAPLPINLVDWAQIIGLSFALCVCAYECWQMMLGRRTIDVFKLGRIVLLSIAIGLSNSICTTLRSVTYSLEGRSKAATNLINQRIAMKEKEVAMKQDLYYQKIRALQDSISHANRIAELGEDAGKLDQMLYVVTHINEQIDFLLRRSAVAAETKITEYVNLVIRFIGEIIFQIAFYGILLMQFVYLKLLTIFAPIAFAFSIAPPWSSAWSQWVSKFLSISLWGFVAYFFLYYADGIIYYTLSVDSHAYDLLIGSATGKWDEIATLGMQGIGSTCFYVVGMLIGAMLIKSVPEVSGWLIPGGVSASGAGAAAASAIGGAVGGGMGAASVMGTGAIGAGKAGKTGAGYAGAAAKGAVVGAGASLATNPSGLAMPQAAIKGAIDATKLHHLKRQDKKNKNK